MNKEDFIKNVNDPKNIPGIYNYCDRWCERCSFTDKCSNYAISDEQFKGVDLNLEKEDEIFKILIQLERLRNATEIEFPNARTFIRPGFDE